MRIENGVLAEHWDVLQDEATRAESKSGLPMFGDRFPHDANKRDTRSDGTIRSALAPPSPINYLEVRLKPTNT